MEKYKRVLILIAILLILFLLFVSNKLVKSESLEETPKAQSGILDLRTWDFNKVGLVKLDGEWDYYEGDFLSLEEVRTMSLEPIKVPSKLKGKGKGTYHLHIKLPASHTIYGMKINSIRMAHALFVNEELLRGSDITKQYTALNTPYSTFFYTDKESIDVIVQVENRDFVDRGIVKPIYFGTQQAITSMQNIQFGLNFGLILILVLFSIYYLIVYTNRKSDQFFLYSGLYFFILAISISFSGEKVIQQLVPEIPFQVSYKIKDGSGFLTMLVIIMFFKKVGFTIGSKKGFLLISAPIIIHILLIVVLPYSAYSIFQYWVWGYVWILFCFILTKMIALFLKKRLIHIEKNELVLIFLAFSCMTLFLGMEIFTSIYPVTLYHEVWLLLFIIVMFTFIAIKTTNSINLFERARDEAIRTKISYLNLQIKPHFIYNAISNIISLCYSDSRKAAQLLSKLSTYLRLIFENNRQDATIPFQKELELIKAYVEIEKTRLNDRIDVQFSIEDNITSLMIPSLSIQPFVENAIRHGLFNKLSRGNVTISAKTMNSKLEVIIEDDGIGMSLQQVSQILNDSNRQGIGIQNVHHRLMMIQGASLEILSTENKGTTVYIQLPIKSSGKESGNASNNYY